MANKRIFAFLVAIGMVLLPAFGQSFFGTVVGTVTDASGSVVPAAEVVLTNNGTAERRTVMSDANGNYQFVNLVPGSYKVDVEKTGFKHFVRTEVTVQVQGTSRVEDRKSVV